MKRLTDDRVADNLKENIEGLQAKGYEPDMSNLRYVRLAEYERTGLSPEEVIVIRDENLYRIKKPIVFKTEEFDMHGEHYQITRAYCPNCSNCDYVYAGVFGTIEDFRKAYGYTDELPNYCPKCGQAWDWSEILNGENK